jgi:hypothetical protein
MDSNTRQSSKRCTKIVVSQAGITLSSAARLPILVFNDTS